MIKCCDNCIKYIWYWDWCTKWRCEVDGRSVYSCFKGRFDMISENDKKNIADIIYNSLPYMYCDNCRYNSEEEGEYGDPCEDCHRKYNGWAISKGTSEGIANDIQRFFNK